MAVKDISSRLKGFSKIPIICGPTASGKSSIALRLCEITGGELLSCDSMQIYMHLDVGTAKATEEERARVPHHLTDIVEPGTYFSVNDYVHKCYEAIEDCLDRGKLPVICGGTGQYISALRDGVKFVDEPVPDSLVAELEEEYDKNGAQVLYSRLEALDPEAATKMHMNNKRRVVRALAVCLATGKTFTAWNSESMTTGPMYPFVLFEPDYEDCRSVLYDRINKRVDVMVEEGIIEEAKYLYSLDIDRKSTCFQAIGYKEFAEYIKDPSEENLNEAVYKVKLNSRHYAKRQLTWFRYIDNIVKLDISTDVDTMIKSTIMPNLQ